MMAEDAKPATDDKGDQSPPSNVWIFQGNPDLFDLSGYTSAYDRVTWEIRQGADIVSPGDRVFLWQAAGKTRAPSGILLLATVDSEPWSGPDEENARPFWRHSEGTEEPKLRVWLRVDKRNGSGSLLGRPQLLEDPVCRDLRILRQPAGTNFRLRREEGERLLILWRRHMNRDRNGDSDMRLDPARSIEEVRESLQRFAKALASGDTRTTWATRHPSYFVYDPKSGDFAPSKFAGWKDMTVDRYANLQALARQKKAPSSFNGSVTRARLSSLLGRSFHSSDSLSQKLAEKIRAGLDRSFQIPSTWTWKFLQLEPAGGQPEPSGEDPGLSTTPTNRALNTVLYGPPGTGKTYQTISLAVEICDGETPSDREEAEGRFQELRDEGRIRFVTFHQSFSYEEFVEGIRPVLDEEEESEEKTEAVRYQCRPGIFKTLCEAAQDVKGSVTGGIKIDPSETKIWKMSLGNTLKPEEEAIYEECIEYGYLLLGWGYGLDYTGCDTREAVAERHKQAQPDITPAHFSVTAVHAFKNRMKVGNIVIVTDGNYKFRAIGRVTGEYEGPQEDGRQKRAVEWLATFEPSLSHEKILTKIFSQATIYRINRSGLKIDALNALLSPDQRGPTPNHVLIIDEINRGNISKILGELITLLEPDKRIGATNELRVTLPYSGESFGVPPNVYLIGTMNTADRSIAFLDTALRRRFEFLEMMPDSKVIRNHVGEDGVLGGVDVVQLLDVLNDRIELLFDRDHAIGHSYLMKVQSLSDLRHVLVHRVIPLLQEYFYGDWERLCQVVGCPFNPEDGKPVTKNQHPLITTKLLDPSLVLTADDSTLEIRIRCELNPEFLAADEEELAAYFQEIVSASGSLNE